MFTFHHANAYQTLGPEGQHLLVLDTASWDEISFDANQHNLSPKYYQGGVVGLSACWKVLLMILERVPGHVCDGHLLLFSLITM